MSARATSSIHLFCFSLVALLVFANPFVQAQKGGGLLGSGGGGGAPSPYLVDPRPGDAIGPVSYGGIFAFGGDTQDGVCCPPKLVSENGVVVAVGDASYIGAAPFDLGALLQGDLTPPTPWFDPLAAYQSALTGMAINDPPNYGTSFAFGGGGTVGTNSGAFVHPFTLLTLPAAAPNMALELRAQYRSDAQTPPTQDHYLPFGPGFSLSGLDFIHVAIRPGGNGVPGDAVIYRGDGGTGTYAVEGTGPFYASPPGLIDKLVWDSTLPGFRRNLPDGRIITYVETQPSGSYFKRTEVFDRSTSLSITYEHDPLDPSALPAPVSITDTRGIKILLGWTNYTSTPEIEQRRLNWIQIEGEMQGQIDFTFDGTTEDKLQDIEFFPTTMVADQNGSGQIELGAEKYPGVRPTVHFDWGSSSGKIEKIIDMTFDGSSSLPPAETRLSVTYDPTDGRVTQVVEGDGSPVSGPVHTFGYSAATRTYTNPRGTITTLELDTNGRVTKVTMQAADTPSGKPRKDEGIMEDHDLLEWVVTYSCSCSLPGKITMPEGREYEFTWMEEQALLTKLTIDDPVGPMLKREHQLGYQTQVFDNQTLYQLSTYTDPEGEVWSFTYTRDPDQFGWGRLISVIATSPLYNDSHGTAQPAIQTTYVFGSRGELIKYHDGQGTIFEIQYAGLGQAGKHLPRAFIADQGNGRENLTRVFDLDDLGVIQSISEEPWSGNNPPARATIYDSNLYYRALSRTSPVGPGNESIESEWYYDRRGNPTVFQHENRDEDGNLRASARDWNVTETLHDQLDRLVRYTYDQAALDAASDLVSATYTYTDAHELWKVEYWPDFPGTPPEPDIRESTVEYVTDGYGMLYKVIRDVGGLSSLNFVPAMYSYDKDGNLIKRRDGDPSDPNLTTFTPNEFAELEQVLDAENGKVVFGRDAFGRIISRDSYDDSTQVLLTRTEWEYNEIGQIIKRHRKLLNSSGVELDTEIVKYDYNLRSQITQVEHPQERGIEREYDTVGRLSLVRDKLTLGATGKGPGNEVKYIYEPVTGRVKAVQRTDVSAGVDDFAVPPSSPTTAMQEIEFAYDNLDRVVTRTQKQEVGNSSGSPTVVHSYQYDSFGFQVRYTDSNSAGVRRMFDPLGRMRERTEFGGGTAPDVKTTTNYIWNPDQRIVERRDGMTGGNGPRFTQYAYDKAGRVFDIQSPGKTLGGTTHQRTFVYDKSGNVEKITMGTGTIVDQEFDRMNRLTQREVRTGNFGPDVSLLAAQENFTYDALGRLETAETLRIAESTLSPLTKVTFAWDSLSRMTSETFNYLGTGGPLDRTVTSDYAIPGGQDFLWRRKVSYPSGFEVSLTPDGVGKLQQMDLLTPVPPPQQPTSELLTQYRYAGGRPLERQLHYNTGATDQHNTEFQWDGQRRLEMLTTDQEGGAELWHWEYGMGLEGHLLTEKYVDSTPGFGDAGNKFHKLDDFYSLNESKIGVPAGQLGGSYSSADYDTRYIYDLDDGHNRQSEQIYIGPKPGTPQTPVTYAVEDNSHRYETVGGTTYQYDGEGNLTFDGNLAYVYDFRNRLSGVYQYIPGGGAQAQSSGLGQFRTSTTYKVGTAELSRLKDAAEKKWVNSRQLAQGFSTLSRSASTVTSGFVGDGTLVLVALYGYDPFNRRVYRARPEQQTLFSVYDGWREIEEVAQTTEERAYVWGAGLDELVCYAEKSGSTWTKFYGHQDKMGSMHRLVDGSGAIVESYSYTPYGQLTSNSGGSTNNPYLWTGRRFDSETGLYYFRNRYYSPNIGRFLTEDPLGVWADIAHYGNPYAYAGNSPFNLDDPFGHQTGRAARSIARGTPGTVSLVVQTSSPGSTGHTFLEYTNYEGETQTMGIGPYGMEFAAERPLSGIRARVTGDSNRTADEIETKGLTQVEMKRFEEQMDRDRENVKKEIIRYQLMTTADSARGHNCTSYAVRRYRDATPNVRVPLPGETVSVPKDTPGVSDPDAAICEGLASPDQCAIDLRDRRIERGGPAEIGPIPPPGAETEGSKK